MARPLPVTLVGGFLGAGKTSLLHHLISQEPGGNLAVLVEGAGPLGFDTKALRGLCGAMRREYDVVEEFADDAGLAEALRAIAQAGRHERVLVEVSGLTSPARWARLIAASHGAIQVEAIVVVVDLLDFHRAFVAPAAKGNGERLLHDFQRGQIESAGLLVLNKCDLAGDAERQAATRALRALNPSARIVETDYGEVPPEEIFRAAAPKPAEERAEGAPSPELESVVFRAFRPFHPQRFWDWFNAPHAGLLRVKGIVWLATRNLLVGGVSRTGAHNSCGAAGIWWAALPREEWPEQAERLMEMQDVWREPYGDRRQELVLLGEAGRTGEAARKLNLCLLSGEEAALPDWRGLPDPFPAWDLEEGE
jgi:G3E family GTPase